MRKDTWDNKSTNQYYDTALGTDVPESGASLGRFTDAPESEQPRRVPHSSPYWVKDVWQAAYLDIQHIPFLYCEFARDGRPRWYFDNDDDRAFQAGKDFVNGEVTVPLQQYRQSYRFMQNQLNALRERGVSYGADRAA